MLNPAVSFFSGRDGVGLAYREVGEGRPLVLLHGLVGDATLWLRHGQAETIAARGYRVIMPDFRGHGRSAKPHDAAAYPLDVLTDDGFALLEYLGLDDYDLGGYSLGARIVVRMVVLGVGGGADHSCGGSWLGWGRSRRVRRRSAPSSGSGRVARIRSRCCMCWIRSSPRRWSQSAASRCRRSWWWVPTTSGPRRPTSSSRRCRVALGLWCQEITRRRPPHRNSPRRSWISSPTGNHTHLGRPLARPVLMPGPRGGQCGVSAAGRPRRRGRRGQPRLGRRHGLVAARRAGRAGTEHLVLVSPRRGRPDGRTARSALW